MINYLPKIFFVFSIIFLTSCSPPEQVTAEIQFPKKVKLDEYFKIYIRVNNEAERNRVISSIDFEKDFLKGIHIIGTDPKPRGEYFAVGYHVFEFRQRIGAKQSQKITFTAKAIKAGDHMGDLDVCVDGDSSCLLDTIRVLVTQ